MAPSSTYNTFSQPNPSATAVTPITGANLIGNNTDTSGTGILNSRSPKWVNKLRKPITKCWTFTKGPVPPERVAIRPFFPRLQSLPVRLLHRLLPRRRYRVSLLVIFWAVWLIIFVVLVKLSRFQTTIGGVEGGADGGVYQLKCFDTLWFRNAQCGLDGNFCWPFESSDLTPFRCPSGCLSGSHVLNPRTVGNQSVIFRPFVVGGPTTPEEINSPGVAYDAPYRADSFICAAAIHAGVVSNKYGGCGLLKQTGAGPAGGYIESNRHKISSVGFDASFPSSFVFVKSPPGQTHGCSDLRWHLLPISVTFTALQSLFTQHVGLFFAPVFAATFFHVGLVSDPPPLGQDSDPYLIINVAISRFLPASFVAYVLWLYVIAPTLTAPLQGSSPTDHPHLPTSRPTDIFTVHARKSTPFPPMPSSLAIERTLLFLLGLWIGSLNNLTFDPLIPLARLTPRDLAVQPGAKAALSTVIIALIAITLGQMYYLRKEGRLPRYLLLYISFGVFLGVLAVVSGSKMHLRIHHYILAMLLLPGTKIATRPSLLYQGLLIGLFINGIARWGFAGILETEGSIRGDGVFYSDVPTLLTPSLGDSFVSKVDGKMYQNVTIRWEWPLDSWNMVTTPRSTSFLSSVVSSGDSEKVQEISGLRKWDGVAVLVNDVERFMGTAPENVTEENVIGEFLWSREEWLGMGSQGVFEKLYVRIAYTTSRNARGFGDFSRAGVVDTPGYRLEWIAPESGRT